MTSEGGKPESKLSDPGPWTSQAVCQAEPIRFDRTRGSSIWEGRSAARLAPIHCLNVKPTLNLGNTSAPFYRQARAPFRAVFEYPAGQPISDFYYFLFSLKN